MIRVDLFFDRKDVKENKFKPREASADRSFKVKEIDLACLLDVLHVVLSVQKPND